VITGSVYLSIGSSLGQVRKPPMLSVKPAAKALGILNKTGSVCINVRHIPETAVDTVEKL
jgi:hypothetical protein